MTFGFGLIHGFGFSFLLRERLQFAGEHLVTSLLAFNVGRRDRPAAGAGDHDSRCSSLIFRFVVAERIGTILMSALVAHTAWHWATERGARLTQYRWTGIEMTDVAAFMRLAMVIVGAAFLMWLMSLWIGGSRRFRTTVPHDGSSRGFRTEVPTEVPDGGSKNPREEPS